MGVLAFVSTVLYYNAFSSFCQGFVSKYFKKFLLTFSHLLYIIESRQLNPLQKL